MSDKDLKKDPHHPKDERDWWWYEERRGISIAVEPSADTGTRVFDIPWSSIRAALRRKDL